MVVLTKEAQEQIKEALRLATIFMLEDPQDDSPLRAVQDALELVSSARSVEDWAASEGKG